MKRITMILIATLALALLVYAQSRTPVQTPESRQAARPASGNLFTPALRDEYKQLIKSGAGRVGRAGLGTETQVGNCQIERVRHSGDSRTSSGE